MGKSYRRDSKNENWRKAKQQKDSKKFHPTYRDVNESENQHYSPFDDSQDYHESFGDA